jgi:DNA-binding transcriptional regulator YdaS (Cro superfamily)
MDAPDTTPPSAIVRACKACGSAAMLASAIGKSQQFVSQMVTGNRPVPAELCPVIERATGGAVRCEDLRPDVAWDVLRAQTAPMPVKGPVPEPSEAPTMSEMPDYLAHMAQLVEERDRILGRDTSAAKPRPKREREGPGARDERHRGAGHAGSCNRERHAS